MQFYAKRTVTEQANRLPIELREAYLKSPIDRITIFDGEKEIELTGYAEYSYLDEKSYKTQPVRTQDGVIQEIEEYATFLTPRLVIKYNMMGIEDYRKLMKMLKKQNSFLVKCYDVVEDKIVRSEMYHATPSMPIIYQQYLIALGIQEYTIELIGTNRRIEFSIAGIKYSDVKWTTWGDFCYDNPENFFINEDGKVIFKYDPSFSVHDTADGLEVLSNDLIIEDGRYFKGLLGTVG